MKSLVQIGFETSDSVKDGRNPHKILAYALSEFGELADEVNASSEGHAPGEDGIVGEAIDVIVNMLDIIHVTHPYITEQDLTKLMHKKCNKWLHTAQNLL